MNAISFDVLLDIAVKAAKAAGMHAKQNKARRKDSFASPDHDLKLLLDVEAQKIAEGVILSAFPNHSILGEEDTTSNDATEYEWIIDPIDGTVNFSQGFEYWCSSVAVRLGEQVLAGCVFAPDLDACYSAHIESEAKRNGEPIRVSQTQTLREALVVSGVSKYMATCPEPHFERFRQLELQTRKVRIFGAAALDICRTAEGASDAFFESDIYLWDYAAGGLIAERAGAAKAFYPHKTKTHAASLIYANPHLIGDLKNIFEA